MKKQIKDLTLPERLLICDKYVYDKCEFCPFNIHLSGAKLDGVHICVHAVMNVLERTIELDEHTN